MSSDENISSTNEKNLINEPSKYEQHGDLLEQTSTSTTNRNKSNSISEESHENQHANQVDESNKPISKEEDNNKNDLVITDSNDADDSVNVSEEETKSPVDNVEKPDLTESTVVLTKSQLIEEVNTTSFIDIDDSSKNKNNTNDSNTESVIINTYIDSSSSSMASPVDNKEFNKQNDSISSTDSEKEQDSTNIEEEVKTLGEVVAEIANEKEEAENLEKGYVITGANSLANSQIEYQLTNGDHQKDDESVVVVNSSSEPAEKKPKRNIQDETYLQILGNDSLLKKITKYGDEDEVRPRNGQIATISFDGYLKDAENRGKLVDHNDNLSFILGDGDVISGLDMVVSLMNKNENCEAIIESRHAYGARGKEPDIPPNATLIYDVHLKEFRDVGELGEMKQIERLSMAEAKKLRGNYHFNRQDFYLAINSYKKGLKYFDEENLRGDEEEADLAKYSEVSQALLMNMALSNYKMGENREALACLDKVLNIQSKHIKALYIKGKVLLTLGETQEAINSLNASLQLDPNNIEVKKELAKAQAKHKIQYQNEKKLYQKMISGVAETRDVIDGQERLGKIKSSMKNKNESSYKTFIAAGLAIALVSVGIALFAKYRN